MDPYKELLAREPDPRTPTVATDLEGTLTAGGTVKTMHGYLVAHGQPRASYRLLLKRLPIFLMRRSLGRPLRTLKNDWMRDLLRLFAGMTRDEFARMAAWVVEQSLWPQRRQKVVAELKEHLAQGRRVLIVTGMYGALLSALLERLPGMEAIGTPLLFVNDTFTGETAADFTVGERKAEQLRAFTPPGGKIYAAYGDTISDSHMLSHSQHPVAVAPDKKLRRLALEKGWRILEA